MVSCLLMLLSASQLMAQGNKVSVKCVQADLPSALYQVEKQSGYYKVNYNYDLLKSCVVSADIKDLPALEALNTLLASTPYTVKVDGKQIYIIRKDKAADAKPSRKATGQLLDSNGNPLVGVSVRIVGTQAGTVTDSNGEYVLDNVPQNAQIEYSYIGMKSFRRKASNKHVTVIMEEDTSLLADVVVTGYQTLSSERSAGSFGTVKGSVISDKVGLTGNIIQSMEGLATGLSVNMSEGADKFTVRGITSINSNRSPLFVVDGIPLENSQVESLLNGNDVESITVLKDATAASIWGAQAANGVIVITTKKGSRTSKLQVSYNGSVAYTSKPDYGYMNKMDNATFLRNAQEMFDQYASAYSYEKAQSSTNGLSTHSNPVIMPHERLMYQCYNGEITTSERDAALQQLASQNGRKQYEKYFMSDKYTTRHSLSLAGGSDKATYYLSVGYIGNKGADKDGTDRFTVNAKEDFNLTKWLKWDLTVNASYGNSKSYLSPWKDYANDRMLACNTPYVDLPYATFYDGNGKAVDWSVYTVSDEKRESVEGLSGIDMSFYPVDDFNSTSNKTIDTNLRVNTGLTLDLFKGLRYETRFQYSRFHSKTEKYYPEGMWKIREEILASTPKNTPTKPWLPTSGGNFILANGVISDWTFRNQLSYNGDFKDGLHQITALAGTEVREYKNTTFNNFLRGYDIQTMQYTPYDEYNLNRISNALMGNTANVFNQKHYEQSEVMRRYFSLYANAAYTYKGKYTLNASLRMDQSNLFGSDPDSQYKPIWALGAAWKMSDEAFMKDISWLNRLSLRATYGFAGNSPQPGQGGKYDILQSTSSSFFETTGFTILTPANDKITWEKTRTWNLGFDASILKNRLSITFDYYDKKTTDLIGEMLLNPMSGWNSTTGNVGTMTNRGFEVSLNSRNITAKNFNWNTTLTLTHNSNKITKLSVATPYTAETLTGYGALNVEGYPVNSLFSYRYAGLNEKGEPQAYTSDGTIVSGASSYGLAKEDVVYSGTTVPKFYGGLTNRFSYKNWELSFMFVYNFGNKMRNECETFQYGRPTMNLLNDFDNRWRKAGDENVTDIPAWNATKSNTANYNLYYMSDRNILNASYIKLRDLSLAYNVPKTFCRKVHTESVRVNLQVGNLFYWAANNKGIDPESYQLDTYTNARQYKFRPTYSIELNINF